MALQKANTEAIAAMANAISSANGNINSAFEEIRNNGNSLDSNWNSKAGSSATTLMYSLFRGNEARSAVLENYVAFLQQSVNPGYTAAEESNVTLADQFL